MNRQEVFLIALTVFLTIAAWILLEIKSIRDETPTEAQIESINLNYTINTRVLDDLKERIP